MINFLENVVKISEVLGVTNVQPFSLGKYERKFATKKSTEFFTLGGGGKNAKFHHLNLLGAALRNLLAFLLNIFAKQHVMRIFVVPGRS